MKSCFYKICKSMFHFLFGSLPLVLQNTKKCSFFFMDVELEGHLILGACPKNAIPSIIQNHRGTRHTASDSDTNCNAYRFILPMRFR